MTAFWSLFLSEKAHFLQEVAHFSLKVAHFRQNRWHLVAAHSPKQVAHWGKVKIQTPDRLEPKNHRSAGGISDPGIDQPKRAKTTSIIYKMKVS
jgi:hypothetical protein